MMYDVLKCGRDQRAIFSPMFYCSKMQLLSCCYLRYAASKTDGGRRERGVLATRAIVMAQTKLMSKKKGKRSVLVDALFRVYSSRVFYLYVCNGFFTLFYKLLRFAGIAFTRTKCMYPIYNIPFLIIAIAGRVQCTLYGDSCAPHHKIRVHVSGARACVKPYTAWQQKHDARPARQSARARAQSLCQASALQFVFYSSMNVARSARACNERALHTTTTTTQKRNLMLYGSGRTASHNRSIVLVSRTADATAMSST